MEVVELKYEPPLSLDPHRHRHLWLSVKVRGTDVRWSNLDTRAALKFQNVVNAEGDIAAAPARSGSAPSQPKGSL